MMWPTAVFSSIFQAILAEEELDLENLTVEFYNLGNVDGDLLSGAVTRMKTVNLCSTYLTTSQTTAFFQAILTQEERHLENLTIALDNLGEVDGELLAGVVTKMKTVNLDHTSLTTSQVTDICHAIQAADGELELEYLNIEGNDLRGVDSDLLAGAVIRIKTVNLTCLPTATQVTAILHAIMCEKAGLNISHLKKKSGTFDLGD